MQLKQIRDRRIGELNEVLGIENGLDPESSI